MAREHANIRLDMWGDADWRSLSRDAQWLYELLLTHPDTNRAGVSDWRPGRLAKMCTGTTAEDVRRMGRELAAKHFLVIDEDTEEVLIRSYVKYDGVLKQPNLTITMANDWTGVASPRLMAVIAHEVQKLRAAKPELPGWKTDKLSTILAAPTLDVRSDPKPDPSVEPSRDPSVRGGADPTVEGRSTSTSTSTSTNASHSADARRRETALPKTWAPTAEHIKRAKETGVNVADEADSFRLHAETHDRRAANWNAAFTTWLKKAKPAPASRRPGVSKNDEWMYR
ncbi:hypothetical protein OR221_0835 [Microbacterium laevaniformans OR221]|nr:hypothetical protein OR221_0835 [Microbacterium laevaniformans OR221]